MAAFVFNRALGRVAEFYNRVDTDDPVNSVLVIAVLAGAGLESDATLKQKDDLAGLVSGTTNEVTNVGYARKVLTQADLATLTPDDTGSKMDLVIPNQTWTAVSIGDDWAKLVVCYDPDSTTGTDSSIIPLTCHDFVRVPDGTAIPVVFAAAGFFRAA